MHLKFADIFGQDRVIAEIRGAVATDHLPHGLIFAGPSGVGKGTTAGALAALFLCEKPAGDQACGKCQSCQYMQAGTHPDFHVVTKELVRLHDKTGKSKATELSIHVIRHELAEPAGRKTNLGRGKVFIVEQAELMNAAAQNGLLKTLEEPAGRTLIILLTDRPESLLATIRSRCQIFRFLPLDAELVRRELCKHGTEAAIADAAVEIAEGSLGLAMQWIADGVVNPAREVSDQVESMLLGKPSGDLAEMLKASAEAYADKQMERDELASKDAQTRAGLELYLSIASRRLRKRLGETEDPDQLERACQAIDSVALAEQYLDANGNVALVLQHLAMSLQR